MKDLVNLAIASTVAFLRKGFQEWHQSNPQFTFLSSTWESYGTTDSPSRYDGWESVPIIEYSVMDPAGQFSDSGSFQLNRHLYTLKNSAGSYVNRTITREQLNEENKKSSNYFWDFSPTTWTGNLDNSEVAKGLIRGSEEEGIQYPGMPLIGPDPIRFRPPSPDELQNDQQWDTYLMAREKFYKKQQLYEISKSQFVLETMLRESQDTHEIRQIKKGIAILQNNPLWKIQN